MSTKIKNWDMSRHCGKHVRCPDERNGNSCCPYCGKKFRKGDQVTKKLVIVTGIKLKIKSIFNTVRSNAPSAKASYVKTPKNPRRSSYDLSGYFLLPFND